MYRLESLAVFLLAMAAQSASGQLIIAHRGASHAAPENTLSAFRLAWELGADGIEGDFHLSSDGRIVCIHDKDTERVTGKKLFVHQTSFADLRKLDVGSWKGKEWAGERIPTLDEVLATVPRGKRLFIELKCGPEIVPPLKKTLNLAVVPMERLAVISFDQRTILACEEQISGIKTYWLTNYKESTPQNWSPSAQEVVTTLESIHADGLGSKAMPSHVDRDFLNKLSDHGIRDFHVWTVDDPQIGRIYQRMGAHAITTNRPAFLRAELDLPVSQSIP